LTVGSVNSARHLKLEPFKTKISMKGESSPLHRCVCMRVSASVHVSACSHTDLGIQLILKEPTTGLLNSFMT